MTDQEDIEIRRWRKAIAASKFVLMPDKREFMIMWRFYEQFGIRHLETGEQYSLSYQEARDLPVTPLLLCPIDLSQINP